MHVRVEVECDAC